MENVTDEKYIGLICNGEFNAIPNLKIGELFESFFSTSTSFHIEFVNIILFFSDNSN